jgi:hypothetical protein
MKESHATFMGEEKKFMKKLAIDNIEIPPIGQIEYMLRYTKTEERGVGTFC